MADQVDRSLGGQLGEPGQQPVEVRLLGGGEAGGAVVAEPRQPQGDDVVAVEGGTEGVPHARRVGDPVDQDDGHDVEATRPTPDAPEPAGWSRPAP